MAKAVFFVSLFLFHSVINLEARNVGSESELDFGHRDPHAKTQGRCETVTIPMCMDMPYNETYLPNNLGHATQEEAGYEANQYYGLVKVQCSPALKTFLCALVAPACNPLQRPLPPCRSLCQTARSGCERVMLTFGFAWPEIFECNKFPQNHDLCVNDDIPIGTPPPAFDGLPPGSNVTIGLPGDTNTNWKFPGSIFPVQPNKTLVPVSEVAKELKCPADWEVFHLKHAAFETKFATFSDEQKLKVLELERKCSKCDANYSQMAAVEAKLSKFEELQAQIIAMETKIFNVDALNARVAALEAQVAKLKTEVAAKKSVSGVIADSLTIGRWIIRSEGSTLVFRDNESGGDKRYAFPAGGHSDMYKAGTGGEIHTSRIVFPIRWSIGEESVSFLVFRDRGVPGHDRRYAMSANLYRDL